MGKKKKIRHQLSFKTDSRPRKKNSITDIFQRAINHYPYKCKFSKNNT